MKKDCTNFCSDSKKEYNEKTDIVNTYKYIYTGVKSSIKPSILFLFSVIMVVVALLFYPVSLVLSSILLYATITNSVKNRDILSKTALITTILAFLLSVFIFVIDFIFYM